MFSASSWISCEGSAPGEIITKIGSDASVSVEYSFFKLSVEGESSLRPSVLDANCSMAVCKRSGRSAWITSNCWKGVISLSTPGGKSCSQCELLANFLQMSVFERSRVLDNTGKFIFRRDTACALSEFTQEGSPSLNDSCLLRAAWPTSCPVKASHLFWPNRCGYIPCTKWSANISLSALKRDRQTYS